MARMTDKRDFKRAEAAAVRPAFLADDTRPDPLRDDLATLRRSLPAIVGPGTAELWLAFGRIEKALGRAALSEPET